MVPRTDSVDELIEWFEDIVSLTRRGQIVDVPVDDARNGDLLLHTLYRRLSVLGTHGDIPSRVLPPGSLTTTLDALPGGRLPEFLWLGCRSTTVPHAEISQIVPQLVEFGHLGVVGDTTRDGSIRVIEALAGPHRLLGVGHVIDHAFGLMGPPAGGDEVRATAAMRELDRLIEQSPLSHDGGALEIDAPRARARACVCVAMLQQIADCVPVVLAIDGTAPAGPFLTALLGELAAVPAPVLVVRTCRSGRWKSHSSTPSPMSAGARETLAALASVAPGALVTSGHLTLTAPDADTVPPTIAELLHTGAIVAVAADIWKLIGRDDSAGESTDALRHAASLGALADETSDDEALVAIVSLIASEAAGSMPRRRWRLARLLARCGELVDAVHYGESVATDALQRAILDSWRRSCDMPATATDPEGTPGQDRDTAERATVTACSVAWADPTRGRGLLDAALEALSEAVENDGGDEEERTYRLRVGAARGLLVCGDPHGPQRALGELDRWMTDETVRHLRSFATIEGRPGLVSRSVEALVSLHLLAAARYWWPNSAVVGIAALGRVALLDRLDRLDVVTDGEALTEEAVAVLRQAGSPRRQWTAATWHAWYLHRSGRTSAAIAALDGIITDERTVLLDADDLVIESRLRRARCRLDAGDLITAHEELDALLHTTSVLPAGHLGHLAVVQAHGVCVGRQGHTSQAADDLQHVVTTLSGTAFAYDETLLEARRQLASALVNSGRATEALDVLTAVVRDRSDVDLPDAPRMLAALHARAGALVLLGDHAAALDDLDSVVVHRDATLAADDPLLLEARHLRAISLMVAGRPADAVGDLDEILLHRERSGSPDVADLLALRHQRAVCLAEAGRVADALTEIDRGLAAAADVQSDPSVSALVALRAALVRE